MPKRIHELEREMEERRRSLDDLSTRIQTDETTPRLGDRARASGADTPRADRKGPDER